jgi:hypothetical protein
LITERCGEYLDLGGNDRKLEKNKYKYIYMGRGFIICIPPHIIRMIEQGD